jgi:hypothetical protein
MIFPITSRNHMTNYNDQVLDRTHALSALLESTVVIQSPTNMDGYRDFDALPIESS